MRLVIDLQGAQSTNSKRGIGRYSTALAKAMLAHRNEHEVHLLLNGAFADTIEPIKAEFADLLPIGHIHVWTPAVPCHAADLANAHRRYASERIKEAVIERMQPDAVLITSLFEGLSDDAVLTVSATGSSVPTAVVLYDLIPLMNAKVYLSNPTVSRWYLNKIDHLRRADLLLSISASSGREGAQHLGFPEDRISNISTACDAQFKPVALSPARREALTQLYGLPRPFVMYTGGIDHRKNIEGLIRAYAALPQGLRNTHQLAVVCSVQAPERERLEALAAQQGLADGEFVMTGFVPDEDLVNLYNLCQLIVFPSWHEGFGLPALEAMACGRAVIGANTSSVPEVIGRADALFDPFKDESITAKMRQVLEDSAFRAELERHGLSQAQRFSWQDSAHTAWRALEALPPRLSTAPATQQARPRLAYVSPLPLARSGIADYSAELLPELSRHYQIDVVVCQDEPLEDPWVLANCRQLTVETFRQQPQHYRRVLYHFGNSHFHAHMFSLLQEYPGVVVLHDFFLSGITAHRDVTGQMPGVWARDLLAAHGWSAVQSRFTVADTADTVWAYPCNLGVLQNALGVIVHSENSRRLAQTWYGESSADNWAVIPLLRVPVHGRDRIGTRAQLGIAEDDFVVCSFGLLGRTKLNHRLLHAWLDSPLAASPRCRLFFVGQNEGGAYGQDLVKAIRASGRAVEITGWTDTDTFKAWLTVADLAVQLRTNSRGETSAAVLDCANYGIPTIVNAHGAMQDLPEDAVWMLPDTFSDAQLSLALTALWQQPEKRQRLGEAGRALILREHQPRACAQQYAQAIENMYGRTELGPTGWMYSLDAQLAESSVSDIQDISLALSKNFAPQPRRPQLLVDVSELVLRDSRSGIQRVVRALVLELLAHPPAGWQVEPVYANAHRPGYRFARSFTCRLLSIPDGWANDDAVEVWSGDRFLALDLQPQVLTAQMPTLKEWQVRGVQTHAVLYDLLPLTLPHTFVDGAAQGFEPWLKTLAHLNGVIAISRTVADEYMDWLACNGPAERQLPQQVSYFHLGADIENSLPTKGLPNESKGLLEALRTQPSFLMVGTVEARKGHALVLAAVEKLWHQGLHVHLVIVGKQGWKVEALVEHMQNHPQAGHCLHWIKDASDEYLEAMYAGSSCLVAASQGEGFGLPLIEAARHQIPIIARDIPVHREVAGAHAFYFAEDATGDALSVKLQEWLQLFTAGRHPRSEAMSWLTWKQSASRLLAALDGAAPYRSWLPRQGLRFWGNDLRLHTEVGSRQGQSMHTTGLPGFLVFGPYRALAAGRYRLNLTGRAQQWGGGEYFDVCCSGGAVQLLHGVLSFARVGEWTHTATFELQTSITDIEFRLWVGERSKLSVARMEIIPESADLVLTCTQALEPEQAACEPSLLPLSETAQATKVIPAQKFKPSSAATKRSKGKKYFQ